MRINSRQEKPWFDNVLEAGLFAAVVAFTYPKSLR